MDVAGALLPFTQVVRPELTIHVQEVLTQADREVMDPQKPKQIPEIKEPGDRSDDETKKSPVKSKGVRDCVKAEVKNGRKGSPA
ncbi:unnamed protein product [Parnassius apollo]|uniref:(apollo) hypothetical protein n=1 Tax=Parnassius apollo TaxID=110799 RepID=A0A8S3Y9C1_PARAO|nr:unnamed protein product [Parnassius apollo]